MARMSIDDAVLRDPRITLLSQLAGWSRRETLGALLEIWAVCYDRVDCALGAKVIDLIAQRSGFADLMLETELAFAIPSGKLRVAGAKERIEYLAAKSRAGRQGGLKSAESRDKQGKQTENSAQARRNPIAPDPVSASASVPDPFGVPDPACADAHESGPTAQPQKPSESEERSRPAHGKRSRLPDDWQPDDEGIRRASALGLDVAREAEKFRQHFRAAGHRLVDWNAGFLKWLEKAAEYASERKKPDAEHRHMPDM